MGEYTIIMAHYGKCGVENKLVKTRYHNGGDRRGRSAKLLGIFCPNDQPTGKV